MVHQVRLKLSDKQQSKLRNGHRVRVRQQSMEGEGVCLIVHPNNYNIITKAFSKNKGAEIALTPEELALNKEVSTEMAGNGIFGKKFDRSVKKLIGKKATKSAYQVARALLPVAQAGLSTGLMSGATALSAVQPELAPFLMPTAANLSKIGSSYLADPNIYQKNPEMIAIDFGRNALLQQLNAQSGQKLGTNRDAQIANAQANLMSSKNADKMAEAQITGSGYKNAGIRYANPTSNPLKGVGLNIKRGRINSAIVGINGGSLHPALQSQPFSAKFNMQMPPAYQKFTRGNGLYT